MLKAVRYLFPKFISADLPWVLFGTKCLWIPPLVGSLSHFLSFWCWGFLLRWSKGPYNLLKLYIYIN